MFSGQSISRNLIAGVAITVGSASNSAAYQQPTTAPTSEQPRTTDGAVSDPLRTEQAPTLPAFDRVQLHIVPIQLAGGVSSSGILDEMTYVRLAADGALMEKLPVFAQVTSPEMLTLSVSEQKQKINLAIDETRALSALTPEETPDGTFLRGLQIDLEWLAALYEALESIEAPQQQKALDILLAIQNALAKDAQTLDLSEARGSLTQLVRGPGLIAEGIKGEQQFLFTSDLAGVSVLDHLHRLLVPAPSPEKVLLAIDIMADLENPQLAGFQTSYPHCPSGGIHNFVLRNSPGEYTRQVVELYLDGKTSFKSGKVCELDRDAMQERHLVRRSASGTIFQSSLIQYGARNNPRRSSEDLIGRKINHIFASI